LGRGWMKGAVSCLLVSNCLLGIWDEFNES